MTPDPTTPPQSEGPVFSIVRDDPWFRLQRFLHLVPANGGDGVVRRIVFFILLAWLPVVVWALATGHAFASTTGEPLLRHYSIHVRYLIALPVMIFGERLAHSTMKRLLPRFVAMGCVPEEKIPAFREVIFKMIRLRNSVGPWVAIACMVVLSLVFPDAGHRLEEINWAKDRGILGFGGWWYLCVSRPIFQIFLFAWLWRILLVAILLRRISTLGLDLIATHPDKLGGLGFVEGFPRLFAPTAFAFSSVLASKWAHEIRWHGEHVTSFQVQGGIFLFLMLALCLAPLLVFTPMLARTRRKALADYGRLVAEHGRLVRKQWIEDIPSADRSLLEAPELGPSCDVNALYDSVKSMRIFAISRTSVLIILLPATLPLIALLSMEVPLVDLFGKLFKTFL